VRDKPDALLVIAATYDNVDAAVSDYEAVKALYYEVKTSDDFDAAVIAKNDEGKVEIVKKHEQPTRHGAAHGLGWGLAAGAVVALFPAIGILGALTWAVARARRSARCPGTSPAACAVTTSRSSATCSTRATRG
jgi:uncharacterized membrane protein